MDVEQVKEDVLAGRITIDRLIEVVVTSQRALQATKEELDGAKRELDEAKRRIEELERQLGGPPTPRVSQPFSMRAEEQRQEARGKKGRKRKRKSGGGRIPTAEKIAQAVGSLLSGVLPRKRSPVSRSWQLRPRGASCQLARLRAQVRASVRRRKPTAGRMRY